MGVALRIAAQARVSRCDFTTLLTSTISCPSVAATVSWTQFPYLAAFLSAAPAAQNVVYCTGILINNQWVLTAGVLPLMVANMFISH